MDHSLEPRDLFRLPNPFRDPLRRRVLSLANQTAERVLALSECGRLYREIDAHETPKAFADRALELLQISCSVDQAELEQVPEKGPVVIVANHPFGGPEGIILAALLLKRRPDVRIMANRLLQRIPQLRDVLLGVDPFGGEGAARSNLGPLREALRWLGRGGMLVVFPAGEVSHLQLQRRQITDPAWSETVGGLVRCSGAAVVPVYFPGGNGAVFNLLGLIHPRVRTALLPRELIGKRGCQVKVRIGAPISSRRLGSCTSDRELMNYLRLRTYLLGEEKPAARKNVTPARESAAHGLLVPVASPGPAESLQDEIASLPSAQLLIESGRYQVFYAEAGQIPTGLEEIGRLRELTFRAAGEGSGKALDLDAFDAHYSHVILWNREQGEVVGAYRLGRTDEIRNRHGLNGLYTHSLFRLRSSLLNRLGPALEMGRSFVRPEYQRSYSPLLLLWRGIGEYVRRNPRYRILFGPVSISRDYSDLSRQLMVSSLARNLVDADLARHVRPRTPVSLKTPKIKGCDHRLLQSLANNFDDVSALVGDLEIDQKGVPVLLRQYLNLGGKLLAFNLDREFSDVVDGLILVDLAKTEMRTLERYLGKDGAAEFLDWHQAPNNRRCA